VVRTGLQRRIKRRAARRLPCPAQCLDLGMGPPARLLSMTREFRLFDSEKVPVLVSLTLPLTVVLGSNLNMPVAPAELRLLLGHSAACPNAAPLPLL